MENRKIAIFSHGKTPRLGALIPAMEKAGLSWQIFQLGKGEEAPKNTEEFQGVILMGGPMGVYERKEHAFLEVEMMWTEKMIAEGKPVLGICLGCQMLAHMHKGEVYAGDKGFSVGFRPLYLHGEDKVFGNEIKGLNAFCWHGDTYTLGDGVSRLLSGSFYHEQGVKFGEKVYGVQFHPEVTEDVITAWYLRDIETNSLPLCAKPMLECLAEARQNLPPMHVWLEKFIARLFT